MLILGNMYVDFKVSNWERVHVPEDKEKEVMEAIKAEEIVSSNDLCRHLGDEGYEGIVSDTSEQMEPDENGGAATIEIWAEELGGNNVVWNNEIKDWP